MNLTPKGTRHQPVVRRLLSGKRVPTDHEGVRPPTAPAFHSRQPGAGAQRAAALFADVSAPTRVQVTDVPGPVPGQPRRRLRRAAERRRRSVTLQCDACGVFVAGSGDATPQVGEPCAVCESTLQDGWLRPVPTAVSA